jgi:hypothetical protein
LASREHSQSPIRNIIFRLLFTPLSSSNIGREDFKKLLFSLLLFWMIGYLKLRYKEYLERNHENFANYYCKYIENSIIREFRVYMK